MALEERPENERLLAYLREQAVPRAAQRSQRDEDDHELHCHPDLVERLAEVASGLVTGATSAFGLPVLAHENGVAFAFAQGTSLIALRLPVELQAEVVEARGSGRAHRAQLDAMTLRFAEQLGAEWVAADPWPIDINAEAGLAQLRAWCRSAYEHAGRT